MAWDVQATASPTSFNGTSTGALTMPASVQADDILLLFVVTDTAHTITSGVSPEYTALDTITATSGDGVSWFYKVAAGSDSGPNVGFSASEAGVAAVVRVRGADTAGPFETPVTQGTSSTTTAAIDPTAAGALKIAWLHDDPVAGSSTTWGSGFTEVLDFSRDANAYLTVAYKEEDTSGAATYTTTESAGYVIFAMVPAAAATSLIWQPRPTVYIG